MYKSRYCEPIETQKRHDWGNVDKNASRARNGPTSMYRTGRDETRRPGVRGLGTVRSAKVRMRSSMTIFSIANA